jgi:hypothetical protein
METRITRKPQGESSASPFGKGYRLKQSTSLAARLWGGLIKYDRSGLRVVVA